MADLEPLKVKVWGDFACFTRPEMKVERVSYDVMTPSAARGALEAIFWKPQFDYMIEQIDVLRPIRRLSLLRNEVKSKAVEASARKGSLLTIEDDRTQRHSLILRDVAYVIHAQVRVRPGVGEHPAKFRDQLRRRVQRGQCEWRPYLGCREFSAFFGPPEDGDVPIAEGNALGRMLFDLRYDDKAGPRFGEGTPVFFNARLDKGSMRVPQELYEGLLASKRSR